MTQFQRKVISTYFHKTRNATSVSCIRRKCDHFTSVLCATCENVRRRENFPHWIFLLAQTKKNTFIEICFLFSAELVFSFSH